MQELKLDAGSLLPHRGRMRLIDDVTAFAPESYTGTVRTLLKADGPYFVAGVFQAHWLIELAAQASGAICNLAAGGEAAAVAFGYLVSVRSFQVSTSFDLQPGAVLDFAVAFEAGMHPIGQSRCEIRCAGRFLAAGELTFLADPEGARY